MAAGGAKVRILGIDPGSVITGYGIVDAEGNRVSHVASGCLRTRGAAFPQRLGLIYRGVRELVEAHRPDEVAVESVFVHRNADSALKLGQARAAAICGTLDFTPELFEYTPREIKLAVAGTGGAAKDQIQHMVGLLLKLGSGLEPDRADALAVALCHAHSRTLRARLAAAGGPQRRRGA
ncbi:MAG: crossover junction endodeoxyribonuclease RuvC [Gammaproteobacteria bacterium]